jgi:hypothetical protein
MVCIVWPKVPSLAGALHGVDTPQYQVVVVVVVHSGDTSANNCDHTYFRYRC